MDSERNQQGQFKSSFRENSGYIDTDGYGKETLTESCGRTVHCGRVLPFKPQE